MSDLIDRQDAIEAMAWAIWHYPNLSFLSNYGHAHELAEDALKRLSSTETEIIRCKDCKWGDAVFASDGSEILFWICRNWHGATDADGYCHEGEKR